MVAEQALDIDMLKELSWKLLSPDRRRRAVVVLRDRFGVSERRAGRGAGQSRSVQQRPPAIDEIERVLRQRLRAISRMHPRWGWRKAHALCRVKGLVINRKRTHRLWREEGLKRPARVRKKRRIGPGRHQRLRARMWATLGSASARVDHQRKELAHRRTGIRHHLLSVSPHPDQRSG
ncbi:hypothetical protein ACFXG4_42270 [Nocardia sp. NPDC059246]|uniref:hypothetical protein n=1 Tax=unclassified Nocardia TaxID=2637762 RepID=UPI0036B1F6FB